MNLKRKERDKIREIYFKNGDIEEIVKLTSMNRDQVKDLLDTSMFRKYIDKDGVKWKRCKNCKVWRKTEEEYYNRGINHRGTLQWDSHCKACRSTLRHNQRILKPISKEKIKEYNKRSWERNSSKYKRSKRSESLSEKELEIVRAIDRAYYHNKRK